MQVLVFCLMSPCIWMVFFVINNGENLSPGYILIPRSFKHLPTAKHLRLVETRPQYTREREGDCENCKPSPKLKNQAAVFVDLFILFPTLKSPFCSNGSESQIEGSGSKLLQISGAEQKFRDTVIR